MLIGNPLVGMFSAIAPAEIAHTHSVSAPGTAPASSWSPTGVNFGAAAADRYIIVAFSSAAAGYSPASSVTIGGQSATLLGRAGSGMLGDMSLWIALVPSGTSGTVVVNYTTPTYVGMDVFRVTGLESTTPISTSALAGGSSGTFNFGTMNSTNGGFVLACASGWTNVAATYSWSGTLGAVESSDYDPNSFNDIRQSSAIFTPADGSSGTVIGTCSTSFIAGRRGGFAIEMR